MGDRDGGRPAAAATDGLLGAWVSTGDDGERLEFLAGGALLVDGVRYAYEVRGRQLTLVAVAQRTRAGFRLDGDTLRLTVSGAAGAREVTYRRAEAPGALAVSAARLTLPAGWTVLGRAGEVVVLNPVFAAGEAVDALVIVAIRPLDDRAAALGCAALLQADLPALKRDLAGEGVRLDPGRPRASVIDLPTATGVEAAELTHTGVTADKRPVDVWIGLARGAGDPLAVPSVARRGAGAEQVSRARALLAAATFVAPPPVDTSAANLAGVEVGHTSFGSEASLTTVYRFGPGGTLMQRTMFSSRVGGSDSEASGTYTVSGTSVTLSVDGEVLRGEVLLERGKTVGLRIGKAVYRRM